MSISGLACAARGFVRRSAVLAVIAGAVVAAATLRAEEPAADPPPAAGAAPAVEAEAQRDEAKRRRAARRQAAPPPVVVEQRVEGDANGFRLQLQVQGAVVPPPEAAAGADGIVDAVGDLVRAAFGAAAPVPAVPAEAADPAVPAERQAAPPGAAAAQRQAQIRQQAQQIEQFMRPALWSELEFVRASCGSLAPESRRVILAAGREAVTKASLAFATAQLNGGHGRKGFDPRTAIQEVLAGAVRTQATRAEFAAYDRERTLRLERRAEAARVRIVNRLDGQLELTSKQREAIDRDLRVRWQPDWMRMLDDQGMVINGRPLAPDFCDACVTPNLEEPQRRQWEEWRRSSGTGVVGWNWAGNVNLDGQGLQQADEWWERGMR